jgi:hypothetical protein
MTPKEKAIELVEQFSSVLMHDEVYEDSIKCALIAVDEIVYDMYDRYEIVSYEYWNEVKEEIEKL